MINTKDEYLAIQQQVELLIAEATSKGVLGSDVDNDYTRSIAILSQQMAQYEDNAMHIAPIKERAPHAANYKYTHSVMEYA